MFSLTLIHSAFWQNFAQAFSNPAGLADIVLKGSVILVAAWLVNCLLYKSSASVRHLVWVLTIVSLLALPVLTLTLPQWRVSLPASLNDRLEKSALLISWLSGSQNASSSAVTPKCRLRDHAPSPSLPDVPTTSLPDSTASSAVIQPRPSEGTASVSENVRGNQAVSAQPAIRVFLMYLLPVLMWMTGGCWFWCGSLPERGASGARRPNWNSAWKLSISSIGQISAHLMAMPTIFAATPAARQLRVEVTARSARRSLPDKFSLR
jgi:hypothetical protein